MKELFGNQDERKYYTFIEAHLKMNIDELIEAYLEN